MKCAGMFGGRIFSDICRRDGLEVVDDLLPRVGDTAVHSFASPHTSPSSLSIRCHVGRHGSVLCRNARWSMLKMDAQYCDIVGSAYLVSESEALKGVPQNQPTANGTPADAQVRSGRCTCAQVGVHALTCAQVGVHALR